MKKRVVSKDQVRKLREVLKEALRDALTPRELEVYEFIQRITKRTGQGPTGAEIGRHFQFERERARQLVGRLIDKGYIKPAGKKT